MKRVISFILAAIMLLSCYSAGEVKSYAAKMYAEDKIEEIQKLSGFVPGKTSIVTGNCYAFVSAICERLFGNKYQEELYNGYQCRHRTGKFYEVAVLRTTTDMSASSMDRIINFFKQYAMPGDVVHYGSLSNSSSTHTFMIQSVDNTKMRIFHSNFATRNYPSTACHIDTITWDDFRSNPSSSIFYNKMRYAGMGVTINRATNYNTLYYPVGTASTVPPTLSSARTSPTSIKISWNNVAGATKYCLAYKLSSASNYTIVSDSLTTTSYEVTGLTVGSRYNFKVRAFALGKWMDYSDVLTVKALPPTVSVATLKPADKGTSIVWSAKPGLTGVRIYRSATENGTFSLLTTLGASAYSYVDTKVKYGDTYYYKIERYVVVGGKTYSTTSKAFKGTYVLAKPSMIFDRIDSTAVNVTASGDGCQTKFVYYVKSGSKTVQAQKSTTKTQFEIDSLTLGREYTVYAAEKTSLGQGEYGSITFKALPKEIQNTTLTQVKTGIKISFDKNKEADGYKVYKSTTADGTFEEIASLTKDETQFIDKDVKINKAYYYMVKCYIDTSSERYYSECFDSSGPAKYVLSPSSEFTIKRKTLSSMKLSWKAVDFADSYTVSYKIKGGKWQHIDNIKKRSYMVKKLQLGKTYYFKVRGVNPFGNGKFTKKVKIKMLPPTPAAPKTAVKKRGILLTYKPKKYATRYLIYRATKRKGKYKLIATINSHKTKKYLDTNVKKKKNYYYKIVCVTVKNGKTYKSDMSEYAKQKY